MTSFVHPDTAPFNQFPGIRPASCRTGYRQSQVSTSLRRANCLLFTGFPPVALILIRSLRPASAARRTANASPRLSTRLRSTGQGGGACHPHQSPALLDHAGKASPYCHGDQLVELQPGRLRQVTRKVDCRLLPPACPQLARPQPLVHVQAQSQVTETRKAIAASVCADRSGRLARWWRLPAAADTAVGPARASMAITRRARGRSGPAGKPFHALRNADLARPAIPRRPEDPKSRPGPSGSRPMPSTSA